jgi:hypothetical protein
LLGPRKSAASFIEASYFQKAYITLGCLDTFFLKVSAKKLFQKTFAEIWFEVWYGLLAMAAGLTDSI